MMEDAVAACLQTANSAPAQQLSVRGHYDHSVNEARVDEYSDPYQLI